MSSTYLYFGGLNFLGHLPFLGHLHILDRPQKEISGIFHQAPDPPPPPKLMGGKKYISAR